MILGGDVHNAYVCEVDVGAHGPAARVFQIVCSPFRNALSSKERRIVRATGSRLSAAVFSTLARLAGVPEPSADWRYLRRPTFHNSIAELVLEERSAQIIVRRSAHEGEDVEQLIVLHRTELARGDRDASGKLQSREGERDHAYT